MDFNDYCDLQARIVGQEQPHHPLLVDQSGQILLALDMANRRASAPVPVETPPTAGPDAGKIALLGG